MSRKTRRSTRQMNLQLPYGNWPENHNESVRIRKAYERLNARFALIRAFHRANMAAAQAGSSMSALAQSMKETDRDERV